MQTARFEKLRKRALEGVFERKRIVKIWRSIVKDQLREQEIKDIYDYYDFNFNILDRAQAIRASILSGTYKASQPLVYRTEKKFGICRHMVIPQAVDALVLQVLTESLAGDVLKAQPSSKAFYSRSKYNFKKPFEISEYGLSLRGLWIKLQKTIYKFNKEKELIVATDLSNYYDSINITELKKVFSGYLNGRPEVISDLLFGIIEAVSWHPDYLPYSGRGLPTSNLEAIRLLAHSFLFEVDEVLKDKTDDCFTRWMDDIIVGVDSKKEARENISAISDMLKSRGLALNLAKTHIYNKDQAHFNFQIAENDYISSVKILPKTDPGYAALVSEIKAKFAEHCKEENRSAKYWDKVAKRYITLFGRLNSGELLKELVSLYTSNPSLRPNLLIYLFNLGFNPQTAEKVLEILGEIEVFDDISLYQISNMVVQWEIPDTKEAEAFLATFETKLSEFSFSRTNPSDFYSLLWFKAKYNRPDDLLRFLKKYENIWQSDPFLRRQATAVLSRVYLTDKEKVRDMLQSQIASGEPNTVSVALQLIHFSEAKNFDPLLNFYLFSEHKQFPYPLPKFLVLCSVLNSEEVRENEDIKRKVKEYITDPYFKKWLDRSYGII